MGNKLYVNLDEGPLIEIENQNHFNNKIYKL